MSQDWEVYYQNSAGNWVLDTSFYRPQQNIEETQLSTMQKFKMADGSNGYMFPEYKYVIEPLIFFWINTTALFREQLAGYIHNGTKIKIVTHNAETYEGYFLDYKRVWFVGQASQFDIAVTFERTA